MYMDVKSSSVGIDQSLVGTDRYKSGLSLHKSEL